MNFTEINKMYLLIALLIELLYQQKKIMYIILSNKKNYMIIKN